MSAVVVRLASALLTEAGFAHGFSTRAVDLALTAPMRDRDRARFCAESGLDPEALAEASQVHGADVFLVDPSAHARARADATALPIADALVAVERSAVGVRVADCVPVLVADRTSGAVAAIHSGWKGFVAGVVPRALSALSGAIDAARPDARVPLDAVAAIGPCIGPCCFEVGEDVARAIELAAKIPVIARRVEGKAFVDLRAAVRAHLASAGVDPSRIEDVPGCTRCDAARFFSFRRGAESGRMLAAISARSS